MRTLPDFIGQMSAPSRPQHRTDALAPICDINEQCLQMLVEAARDTRSDNNDPLLRPLLALVSNLDASTVTAAARFPFLLVDFGFRNSDWWRNIVTDMSPRREFPSDTPFSPEQTIKLARATTVLAWHTVRTDIEASVVLLGIAPDVATILKSLRLHSIDSLAERYASRVRPRWAEQLGVWRQLFTCAKSTEVEKAHEFVLHALQLTAAGAFAKPDGRAVPRIRSGSDSELRFQ
jgi:hypothetical protein